MALEFGKSARVQELCRKLKPMIGQQAERIWMAFLAEDELGNGTGRVLYKCRYRSDVAVNCLVAKRAWISIAVADVVRVKSHKTRR